MRRAGHALFAGLIAGCTAIRPTVAPATRPASRPAPAITVAELNARPVTGRLGVPMGTLVWIDATVVRDEASLKDSADYQLRVDRCDGRPLSPAPVFDFYEMFTRPPMPTNILDLPKLTGGDPVGNIDEGTAAKLEAGYRNHSFHVRAYEVGRLDGAPTNMHDVYWQDRGFAFRTTLMVVDQGRYPSGG